MTEPCHYCGRPIDPTSRETWHRVQGWERPGRAGGSDIALRERTGTTVACPFCVRQLQHGLSPHQDRLL